jgi:hypothetical protein
VEGHHGDGIGVGVQAVDVGDEGDIFQEAGKRWRFRFEFVLAGLGEQFADVFEAGFGLLIESVFCRSKLIAKFRLRSHSEAETPLRQFDRGFSSSI